MDIGRVFFHYDPRTNKLQRLVVLTLESHVGNVARLAEAWDPARAYLRLPPEVNLDQTRSRLIQAARRHDEAKPQCFRLTRDQQSGRYSYSYRGHRFRVLVDDLYVALLVRLHHEFSVDGVTEAVAALRDVGDFVGAANFPFDLYALEMCDQITAEVESRALGDEAREERVFMEFHLTSHDGQTFQVDPYPFDEQELRLTLVFSTYDPGDEEDPEHLTQRLKDMPPGQNQTKEVVLCPLLQKPMND